MDRQTHNDSIYRSSIVSRSKIVYVHIILVINVNKVSKEKLMRL